MTTVELAQHIIRNTEVDDLSAAPPAKALCILAAINSGIQRFYRLAPSRWNRTGASFLVEAPQSVSCVVTDGSATVANAPFTAAMRGCSVLIDGDPTFNEIVSADQLLNPYLGDTGTRSATIYYDAVTITDFAVERVVTDPVIRETGVRLVRAERHDSISYRRTSWFHHTGASGRRSLGNYPEFYRVDHVGMSDAQTSGDAVVILRLDPIPTSRHVLNFEIDVRPASYTLASLETPSEVPVDDTLAYSALVPLCEAELTRSPVWIAEPAVSGRVEAAGIRAEEEVRGLVREFAKPSRRVATRRGW